MMLSQIREEARSPGGILLPGLSAIEYDSARVNRVIWKIVRGLFNIELSRFLPDDTPHLVQYVHGSNTGLDPEPVQRILAIVLGQEERGEYRRIFAYKHAMNPQENNVAAWAFLFWDRHIFLTAHHDPECTCPRCVDNS